MFKETTIEDKFKVFIDICATDINGKVSAKEIESILKANILSKDDQVKLAKFIR